jgi:hypothetical protein
MLSGVCQQHHKWSVCQRGASELSRCNESSKAMSLDSRVSGGRVDVMVGQSVQPIPHDTEVCDEHSEESDSWQAGRATA